MPSCRDRLKCNIDIWEPKYKLYRFFVYYILWIAVGTFCFAYAPWSHTSGFIYGYYSAINVGYSIGWSWPPQDDGPPLLFSSVYLLFGAGFVALALGEFSSAAMRTRDKWFTKLLKQREYEETFTNINSVFSAEGGLPSLRKKVKLFCRHYKRVILPVSLWITWLIAMMINGRYAVGWSWYTTQYFALTSCSTGGMVAIPGEQTGDIPPAPQWSFLLHAFLTSLGVPFMAWSMGAIGNLMIKADTEEIENTRKTINEPVTIEELKYLMDLELEDGNGEIDKSEFMILCMVRMGIDVQLLKFISDRFEELDADGNGTLSIREVTSGKYWQSGSGQLLSVRDRIGVERGGQITSNELRINDSIRRSSIETKGSNECLGLGSIKSSQSEESSLPESESNHLENNISASLKQVIEEDVKKIVDGDIEQYEGNYINSKEQLTADTENSEEDQSSPYDDKNNTASNSKRNID